MKEGWQRDEKERKKEEIHGVNIIHIICIVYIKYICVVETLYHYIIYFSVKAKADSSSKIEHQY